MLPAIAEPVTMITDYLIALQCLYIGAMLWRRRERPAARSGLYWMLGFVFLAAASLLGGSQHGFANLLSPEASLLMWRLATLAVGPVTFFILLGTAKATLRRPIYRPFAAVIAVKLCVFLWWMSHHEDYVYVIADYGSGLVLVLLMQAHAAATARDPGAPWMMAGVAVSFAAAAVQMSAIELHAHFNHNDLYHVIQMLALYLFYRGARLLRDFAADKPRPGAEAAAGP